MRSAGERIRVTAQLIDAESGYHLWSRSFDREMRDIFRLQDEFAQSIVSALHGPTPHDSAEMLTTPPTADVEAYRLYLQGIALQMRPSEKNLVAANALFEQESPG